MQPLEHRDIKSLNQLFIQLSRQFRNEVRQGRSPHEIDQLHKNLVAVHQLLKSKQFHCLSTPRVVTGETN